MVSERSGETLNPHGLTQEKQFNYTLLLLLLLPLPSQLLSQLLQPKPDLRLLRPNLPSQLPS
jgi:hypothetical protein